MNTHKNHKGFTLLFSVLITSLLLAIAFSIISLSSKHALISSVGRESQVAFYSADSGLECVKYWDQTAADRNAFSTTTSPKSPINCFGVSIPITEEGTVTCSSDDVSQCKRFSIDFDLVDGANGSPGGRVTIEKNIETNETVIDSYGQNTEIEGPRQLERAIKLTYTPTQRNLCDGKGDTMVVLDISGSIEPDEMEYLKDAANDSIERMNPSPPGTHVGMIWFSSHVSLQNHLGTSTSLLQSKINTLTSVSTNGTNLSGGIRVAQYELSGRKAIKLTPPANLNPDDDNESPVHDRNDNEFADFMLIMSDGSNRVTIDPDGTYVSGDEGNEDALASAIAEANAAKAAGTTIFVVGIETGPENLELTCANYSSCSEFLNKAIAGPPEDTDPTSEAPEYFLDVNDFSELPNFPICS